MNTKSIEQLIETYEAEAVSVGDEEESELYFEIAQTGRKLLQTIQWQNVKWALKKELIEADRLFRNKRKLHCKL